MHPVLLPSGNGRRREEVPMDQSFLSASAERQSHVPFPATGSYPARNGNLLLPLVDGAAAFRRICEAMEAARHSVWLTLTFVVLDFQMPDGRGSLFDVLDGAVKRGLDVRVIFWRPNPESAGYGQAFPGSPAERDMLRRRGSRFRARWDRAHGAYCHHQKSWLIDAGRASETAFIGGINPTFRAGASVPGHRGDDQRHDIYVEITGPSACDVHHNFVQRWNGASDRMAEDGTWGHNGAGDDLAFPTEPSPARGASLVQIQRTVHAGTYRDGHPAPQDQPYNIAGGERSVLEQYLLAIDAARRSIYIENQAAPTPAVALRLEAALKRGVYVVALVPAEPEEYVRRARRDPQSKDFFDRLAALGGYESFALVGIAGRNSRGSRSNVYVHGKIMLIDDAWATIGSCNLHSFSLYGNTEMNASFWDPTLVRALRCELLAEHLDKDTSHLDDRAALALYRQIARENRVKRDSGDWAWQGLAFSLAPETYAE
jgi:cardiolipin synthase A/B